MRDFRWKIFFRTPAEKVYRALASNEGRSSFWAESAEEVHGFIEFRFPNGERYTADILEMTPPRIVSIRYFEARTTFELAEAAEGTILTLSVVDAPESDWLESYAGWVSVLMNMKSVIDFGVDLRNHDPEKSWDRGFVDN